MKIIYSIGVNFGSHGMGITAYYAARALYNTGILKKLVCMAHKRSEISDDLIHDVFPGGDVTEWAIIAFAKAMGSVSGYGIKDSIYDYLASKRIEECDIFHGWSMQSVLSLALAKRKSAIAILERPHLHIVSQKKILEEEYELWGIKSRAIIENIEIERNLKEYDLADYILVPSEAAYKTFQQQGCDMNKVMTLPYGYDSSLFKPTVKPKDKFRVLFCGRITLGKGVQYLLRAWLKLRLKNAELILVGKIFADVRTILVTSLQKCSNIVITNFISYKETINHYNNANIFVFPSLQEGSALVTYEAMGCGLPIITTQNAGSVARDGIDGFIVPIRDVDAIAEKIQYFYDNKEKREEMAKAASERARDFTWDKYGERLINLYGQIVKNAGKK